MHRVRLRCGGSPNALVPRAHVSVADFDGDEGVCRRENGKTGDILAVSLDRASRFPSHVLRTVDDPAEFLTLIHTAELGTCCLLMMLTRF